MIYSHRVLKYCFGKHWLPALNPFIIFSFWFTICKLTRDSVTQKFGENFVNKLKIYYMFMDRNCICLEIAKSPFDSGDFPINQKLCLLISVLVEHFMHGYHWGRSTIKSFYYFSTLLPQKEPNWRSLFFSFATNGRKLGKTNSASPNCIE